MGGVAKGVFRAFRMGRVCTNSMIGLVNNLDGCHTVQRSAEGECKTNNVIVPIPYERT